MPSRQPVWCYLLRYRTTSVYNNARNSVALDRAEDEVDELKRVPAQPSIRSALALFQDTLCLLLFETKYVQKFDRTFERNNSCLEGLVVQLQLLVLRFHRVLRQVLDVDLQCGQASFESFWVIVLVFGALLLDLNLGVFLFGRGFLAETVDVVQTHLLLESHPISFSLLLLSKLLPDCSLSFLVLELFICLEPHLRGLDTHAFLFFIAQLFFLCFLEGKLLLQ